jgi:LysM repeat protein
MSQQQRVSIGGLTFDAVLSTSHVSKVTATSHPVEGGANIADHAFIDPAEVTIEIGMTDCNGVGASDKMFAALQALQKARQPITIQTRFKQYTNMLIMSMSTPDDYMTVNALKSVLMCREIPIVSTRTVTITAGGQEQKAGSTNNGTVQAKKTTSTQGNSLTRGWPANALIYTVVSGDNLTKISKKYNTTVKQLVDWNSISNPNKIYVGQELRVA